MARSKGWQSYQSPAIRKARRASNSQHHTITTPLCGARPGYKSLPFLQMVYRVGLELQGLCSGDELSPFIALGVSSTLKVNLWGEMTSVSGLKRNKQQVGWKQKWTELKKGCKIKEKQKTGLMMKASNPLHTTLKSPEIPDFSTRQDQLLTGWLPFHGITWTPHKTKQSKNVTDKMALVISITCLSLSTYCHLSRSLSLLVSFVTEDASLGSTVLLSQAQRDAGISAHHLQ